MCYEVDTQRTTSTEINAWMTLLLKLYTQQQHSSAPHAETNHTVILLTVFTDTSGNSCYKTYLNNGRQKIKNLTDLKVFSVIPALVNHSHNAQIE